MPVLSCIAYNAAIFSTSTSLGARLYKQDSGVAVSCTYEALKPDVTAVVLVAAC